MDYVDMFMRSNPNIANNINIRWFKIARKEKRVPNRGQSKPGWSKKQTDQNKDHPTLKKQNTDVRPQGVASHQRIPNNTQLPVMSYQEIKESHAPKTIPKTKEPNKTILSKSYQKSRE